LAFEWTTINHQQQQRIRMRGILNSEAMSRSLYEYLRSIRAIFADREASEVGLPDEPTFGEDAESEHGDSDSESDVATMYFSMVCFCSLLHLSSVVNADKPLHLPAQRSRTYS
jgi:hypothetical protein